jgi:uncharacterized membrane protein
LKQIGNYLANKWSARFIVIFYFLGGINHFVNPDFYLPLIPPFFSHPELINIISGAAEIILAIGLAIPRTRNVASYLVILMLLAFIPSHVYFIQIGSCIGEGLCTPEWVGWVRLVLIHPFLIYWAWIAGKSAVK